MKNNGKSPLILIAGPTATGKTALAVALAQKIGGEIISADSMQVYRKMDIGTAKATKAEMGGIPHHLIDCLEPDAPFSVAVFQAMAKAALAQIYAKGKTPVIVGGTGFYINALLYDTDFTETETDYAYRASLADLAQAHGAVFLHDMLAQRDPSSAANIHPNNVKRVIRALEYAKQTGGSLAAHNTQEKSKETAYDAKLFILQCDRAKMYAKIDKRVDNMLQAGLLGEVSALLAAGYSPTLTSMQGLGYKELVPVVQGEISLEEATERLKRNTRRFAKRQLTWFRNQCDGTWVNTDDYADVEVLCARMVQCLP